MKAIIKDKKEVAKLTCYAEFELQGERPDFTPGQYFFVTLKPEDQAHQEELTHHFSIVNSPNQKGVLALTTRLRLKESFFKRTLNEAQIGDEVEIGKISGSFVLPDSTDKPIVLIALGIGITPYVSILRWVFEESKSFNLTLIYSDDAVDSMPFVDELKQKAADYSNFKLVQVVTNQTDWSGEKRHIDGEMLKAYIEDLPNHIYYVSGPPPGVTAVAGNLKEAGISEDSIKTDSFSGY